MDTPDLSAVREHVELVIKDAEQDAHRLDRQPFNGRVMGENFGYAFAQIQGLGKMLLHVIDHLEENK